MNRLHGLDGIRGVAALMVFCCHLRTYGLQIPVTTFYLGVDIFFALSGFVMARTYEQKLRDGLPAAGFVLARYRRLWLPAAVGSAIGFAACAYRFGFSTELAMAFAAILLFLPAPWLSQGHYSVNIPIWSLFIEVVCNALHAVALARASNRTLLLLLGACGLFFAVTTIQFIESLRGQSTVATLLTLPRGLASYLIGILIYRKWQDAPLGNMPKTAIFSFPAIIAAFTLLAQPVAMMLTVFVVSPLILRASLALGEARWASWLGAYSFPLYAIHMPFLYLVVSPGAGLPLAAALGLSAAALLTLLMESRRRGRTMPWRPRLVSAVKGAA